MQRTIAGADRVEIALVYDREDRSGERIGPRGVEAWTLRSPWKLLSPGQTAALRGILLERKSWQTERKTCTFNPNVAFRWFAGSDTAGALLCHGCDELIGWQGSARMSGEVDPVADRLLSLTSAAFPNDSLLQAIVARKQLRN